MAPLAIVAIALRDQRQGLQRMRRFCCSKPNRLR
jgi:hypothetical protein